MSSDGFLKEATEILDEWEKERTDIDSKMQELMARASQLESFIEGGNEMLRRYRNKTKHTSAPIMVPTLDLRNLTYGEAIIKIAQASQNWLRPIEATEILRQAGYGEDRRQIQSNIYAAIRRLSKHFQKVNPGEYRFANHVVTKPAVSKRANKPMHSTRSKSGLRQMVKQIKDTHPDWTKQEVFNYLHEIHFDFKVKKEISALNMVWGYLGYSKEGKQQSLPMKADIVIANPPYSPATVS